MKRKRFRKARTLARRALDGLGYYKNMRHFETFLKTVPLSVAQAPTNGKRVGVLISAWHYTPVAWYGATMALLYRLRGYEVTLIWDDVPFSDVIRQSDQHRVVKRMLQRLPVKFELLRLSQSRPSLAYKLDARDQAEIERLVNFYVVARFRSAIPTKEWEPHMARLCERLTHNLAGIKPLLAKQIFDHLVIPCGIYGNTALYHWEAGRLGIRSATYDSGPGMLLTAVDGIAPYQEDVAKALELEFFRDPKVLKSAIGIARDDLKSRVSATHREKFQKVSYADSQDAGTYDVVMPLNIIWDAAALERHRYFRDSLEWILETIDFLLKNTEATIAVREHPVERRPGFGSNHDLGALFRERFGETVRLKLFSAWDDVNTYRLIERCKVVLPVVSTLGIEAAAMGRRVVLEAKAYYAPFDFLERADSKADYFRKIKEVLGHSEKLDEKKQEEALFCYFVSQLANRIPSNFTPQPADFLKWSTPGFEELTRDKTVQAFVTTLAEATPAIVWRTKELIGDRI